MNRDQPVSRSHPRAFISYSRDDRGSSQHALALANRLRREGIDAHIDLYAPAPCEGRPRWLSERICAADYVIVVCCPRYAQCFCSPDAAGKSEQWESALLQGLLFEGRTDYRRVIPVLFDGESEQSVPIQLRSASPLRLPTQYRELYRRLSDQPPNSMPALGPLARRIDNLARGARSPYFIGRERELARLAALVADNQAVGTRVALTGLGGIGKSRLALEFALAHADQFELRWWVRASSAQQLQTDLVGLGRRLGVLSRSHDEDLALAETLRWLATHRGWLLVYDNAADARSLRPFLPEAGSGFTLITSQAHGWREAATSISLWTLPRRESIRLLVERSGMADESGADALALALGDLPLALVQAAAFVNRTLISFADYLSLFQGQGLQVWDEAESSTGDDYGQTITGTWQLAFERLRLRDPDAVRLLEFLAFVDPEGLSLELLRRHSAALPRELARCVRSPLALNKAIAALLEVSLVERSGMELRVHPLVQQVTREALEDEARDRWAATAVDWAVTAFGYRPGQTPVCAVPAGSTAQLRVLAQRRGCVALRGARLVRALGDLGHYWLARGALGPARESCQHSMELAERMLRRHDAGAAEQRNLSVSLHRLGEVELQAGELSSARERFVRALELFDGLAADDPTSTRARRCLSVALDKLGRAELRAGRPTIARGLFMRALGLAEQLVALRPDSLEARRDLCASLHTLARVELLAGHVSAARARVERALVLAETTAAAHPKSGRVRRDLCVCLGKLGDIDLRSGELDAARERFASALEIAEALARNDPDSAQAKRELSASLHRLAEVELQAGELAPARLRFERAHAISHALSQADPDSARARRELSVALEHLGRLEHRAGHKARAQQLFGKALALRERLAKLDPRSAQAGQELATALEQLGRLELSSERLGPARAQLLRAYDIRAQIAKVDQDSAQAQRNLAAALDALSEVELRAGHLGAARGLARRAVTMHERLVEADPNSALAKLELEATRERLLVIDAQTRAPTSDGGKTLPVGQSPKREASDGAPLSGALSFDIGIEGPRVDLSGQLAPVVPGAARPRRVLSAYLQELAAAELEGGSFSTARRLSRRALSVRERLFRAQPGDERARCKLAGVLAQLGAIESVDGHPLAARAYLRRGLDLLGGVPGGKPIAPGPVREHGELLSRLGALELASGKLEGARQLLERAVEICERLVADAPDNARARRELMTTLRTLGRLEVRAGHTAQARSHFQRSLELSDRSREDLPHETPTARLPNYLDRLGATALRVRDLDAARDLLRCSFDLREASVRDDPACNQRWHAFTQSLDDLRSVELEAGNAAAAHQLNRRVLKLWNQHCTNLTTSFDLAVELSFITQP